MGPTDYDPNFEFNAPKYHDFTNPTDDDGADAWFDNLNTTGQEENHGAAQESEAPQEPTKARKEQGVTDLDPAESAMNISLDPGVDESVESAASDTNAVLETETMAHSTGTQQDEQPAEKGEEQCAEAPLSGHENTTETSAAVETAEGEGRGEEPNELQEAKRGVEEDPLASYTVCTATTASAAPVPSPETECQPPEPEVTITAAKTAGPKAVEKPPAALDAAEKPSSRVMQKLTESILSLAEFKSKEASLSALAHSNVAALASREASSEVLGSDELDTTVGATDFAAKCSVRDDAAPSEGEGEGPVASRTRRSLEALKGGEWLAGIADADSAQEAPEHGSGGKRGHKAGSAETPVKPQSKKARAQGEASTPSFSRFTAAPGSARRALSTPRSAFKPTTPSSASSLCRPTSASAARSVSRSRAASTHKARAGAGGKLTVPVSPQLSAATRGVRRQRSHGELGSVSAQLSQSSDRSAPASTSTPRRPTVPVSPRLSSARRGRRGAASTEEARMREAEAAVEQLRKRRKVGEARLQRVLHAPPAAAAHKDHHRHLTVPAAPTLRAATRGRSSSFSALDGGRSAESLGAVSDDGKTLGERLHAFQHRAPAPQPTPRRDAEKRKLTEPKTPDFASFRRRGAGGKSRAEQEEEEVSRMRATQFKARPLDRRVLESAGDLGVPKLARKPLTTPQAPVSHTSSRASVRSSQSSLDSLGALSASSQHSLDSFGGPRPTPRRAAVPVPGSAHKERGLTIPVSPKLASSLRARPSSAAALASSSSSSLSASGASFKARPAPKERPANAKENESRPKSKAGGVTDPKPFKLASDTRHEIHMAHLAEQRRQEEEQTRSFASFHARPVPKAVTDSDKAFTPRRSSKPLTEVHGFELNVDRRGRARQTFEQTLKEREAAAEAERAQAERRRALEEERERRALRRQATVKARPVPQAVYSGSREVPRSSKPLTEPHSPHFRTDARLRSQH